MNAQPREYILFSNQIEFSFREHCVNECKSNSYYNDFISLEDKSDIDKFYRRGFYTSGVGDLMIELCADALCVPIVMLSSAQNMDLSVHLPSKRQLSVSPIIVVHQADGRGVILMEHSKRILMIRLGQVCVLNQSFSIVFKVFVSFLEIATIVKKRNKFLFELQRSNSAKTSISMFFSNFCSQDIQQIMLMMRIIFLSRRI